jgi:hypothetical protein
MRVVSTLCRKFDKAKRGLKETSEAYIELTKALDKNHVKIWETEEQKAQMERGDSLKIYDVRQEEGTALRRYFHIYDETDGF